MYNGRHISFKRILYRAMRHNNASDLTVDQAAQYAYELVRTLSLPLSFADQTEYVEIKNHRAELPKNIIHLRGMRYTNEQFSDDINWLPVSHTGNIYQSSLYCKGYTDVACESDITYTINSNFAFLSEPEGAIEISFKGIMLDDDGYPMIPDNQAFENALYYYILKEHFFPLVGIGKISQYFYEKIEQEYSWAAGQAETSLKLAGMDHWESIMNGIRRFIQYQNFSADGYARMHRREQIKKHK